MSLSPRARRRWRPSSIGWRNAWIRTNCAPSGCSEEEVPMFTIDIDPKTLEEVRHSINRMAQSLEHLRTVDLGHELSQWQVEDVGRAKPFTMKFRRAGIARTIFRPHSWKQVRKSIAYQRRGGRALARLVRHPSRKAAAAYGAFQPLTSTRPYLRPELVEQLAERLLEMAQEKLRW